MNFISKILSKSKERIKRKSTSSRRSKEFVNRIVPKLSTYKSEFPSNPIGVILNNLQDKGILDLPLDERLYLSDLISEELCKIGASLGHGAAIQLRLETFIKGRTRIDVIPCKVK